MAGTKLICCAFLLIQFIGFGQIMHAGKITFERRTNLMKRFNDPRMKKFVNEDNKIKTENFTLLFNDTCSVFKPILGDAPDEMAWMTSRNSYYLNTNKNEKLSILSVVGQPVYIIDSLPQRHWKITESKRKICGYDCRKAIYQKNDSTRLYAWFTVELTPSAGPEGFCGLPGTILGLATEDGGIIYFAKSVDFTAPTHDELVYSLGKNKLYSMPEFRAKIEADFGNSPWGKRLFDDLFRWL